MDREKQLTLPMPFAQLMKGLRRNDDAIKNRGWHQKNNFKIHCQNFSFSFLSQMPQ
jgi:hypothetical protein